VRVRAISALARCQPDVARPLLPQLLRPEQPAALQAIAARLLGEALDKQLAARVLEDWNVLAISTRQQLLGAMLRSPTLAEVLLDAIEQGRLNSSELDAASIEQLRRLPGDALQQRARNLFANDASVDRQAVVDRYGPALQLTGNAQRGAILFQHHCQTCHRLAEQGSRVGPDLTAALARPPQALVEDILNPSKEFAPDYRSFVLTTRAGIIVSGLLAGETANAITLRKSGGMEETILRSDVEEFRSTGKSLMPEGFEQQLAPQDLADVICFLRDPLSLRTD
jgi:putative heme-binding domain-containing protein